MFERLKYLAHDPSPACRAALLFGVTDLLDAIDGEPTTQIAALFTEIILGVLPSIAGGERTELACRIADLGAAPPALIRALASAQIDVAAPVLRRSAVLDDDVLVEFAATLSPDHLVAIASRIRVSERVSDALIARDDAGLLRVLVQNHGAQFSPTALSHLVRQASAVAAGASAPLAEVLPFVPRPSAPARTGTVPDAATAGLGQVIPLPERRRHRPEPQRASINAVMATIASGDRMLEVAALLAEATGLPVTRVSRLIAQSDAMPLAILCKSIGVATDTFAMLAALHGRRVGETSSRVLRIVETYVRLDEAAAENALRFLKQRPSALGVDMVAPLTETLAT